MNTKKEERSDVDSYRGASNDEIDVSAVFNSIGRGFEALGKRLAYLFDLLIRRILLISIFILIGLALALGVYFVTDPYYTSSMTLVLADIRNDFVEDQLNNLSIVVREDNFEAVSNTLDISIDAAKKIKEMKFSNLDAERVDEDSVLIGSPFKIELSLYDNRLFDTMEPALANFLENNRYFSKQKRIRQREVESLISKLKNEIGSIDSLKATVSSPRGPVNGFVYGQPVDPTNLYRESTRMYEQQVDLESELDQLDNIQIVNGFAPRLHPTGPNLLKFLAIGGFIAFIIGLIVALNLEKKKRRKLDL
ncbi:Wzz/FepE/Etk N-terminal domain-containing protein [Pontibacter silvestris]|uniref:Wzz/FepE/Etk N-terminal domain-containing protein n=1 Tax=Pontibacter silvestris TaxID=2305183 RepID=A0ABW4WYC7_9BACT|nr:Wzz/FepE/Etk N-terminal domain-containing protein [Pontibacter silvestris]MCC9135135.1 Wzz/FepE/Etk N-terminal domain-containing protein [Pontibacter silvestris]